MESRFHSLLRLLFLLNFLALNRASENGGAGVIKVNYKFSGADTSLSALRAHDDIRHLSILSGVDLPLGGTGRPDAVGSAPFPFLFVFSIFASFLVFTAFFDRRSDGWLCAVFMELWFTYYAKISEFSIVMV